ncbi:hypothetical protein BJX61DRAFT_526463 [Aspergillus egyptiacus]|nr:hypothetical protein BJX61DRAFT_526463 [Aspergillus egyptiacus]
MTASLSLHSYDSMILPSTLQDQSTVHRKKKQELFTEVPGVNLPESGQTLVFPGHEKIFATTIVTVQYISENTSAKKTMVCLIWKPGYAEMLLQLAGSHQHGYCCMGDQREQNDGGSVFRGERLKKAIVRYCRGLNNTETPLLDDEPVRSSPFRVQMGWSEQLRRGGLEKLVIFRG